MLVTINTDASFNPKFKIGAYSFYIKSNNGVIRHANVLKTAKNSYEAEAMAVANALAALEKSNWIVSRIIINSDCMGIFDKFTKKSKLDVGRAGYRLIRRIKEKSGVLPHLTIHEFRHVKAHTQVTNARSFINNTLDKEAKKHMKQHVLVYVNGIKNADIIKSAEDRFQN
jgi:ribonuclease HI